MTVATSLAAVEADAAKLAADVAALAAAKVHGYAAALAAVQADQTQIASDVAALAAAIAAQAPGLMTDAGTEVVSDSGTPLTPP